MTTEELHEIIANARANMAEDELLPTLARKVIAAQKLVEALQPIADAADECDEYGFDDENQAPIDAGTCRAARAALAAWEAAQ